MYFKSIQIPLTDSYGRELNKHAAAYSEIIELMNGYRDICEAEDFDAAYAQYEKDADKIAHIRQGAATTTGFQGFIGNHAIIVATTPSSSNNNNSQMSYMFTSDSATSLVDGALLPDYLLNSILSMEVGNVALVEHSNGTPCIYLIQRLDIHADPADYANTKKDILYTLKYQEFDAETITKMGEWEIEFAETVMDQCDPKDFCSSDSADAPTPPPTRSTTALTFFPTTTYPYTTTTTPSDR